MAGRQELLEGLLSDLVHKARLEPKLAAAWRAEIAAEPAKPPPDEFHVAETEAKTNYLMVKGLLDVYDAVEIPSPDKGLVITAFEGITAQEAARLQDVGVTDSLTLLIRAGTASGRAHLARDAALAKDRLLRWVNLADLVRVMGLNMQDASVLESVGVDSAPELGRRQAANLAKKLAVEYAARSQQPPPTAVVEAWIARAAVLIPAVSH